MFAYNRYVYCLASPLNYHDPSGHWFENALDIAFIGYDIYDIQQNGLTWTSGLSLAAEVGGLLLPFATGGLAPAGKPLHPVRRRLLITSASGERSLRCTKVPPLPALDLTGMERDASLLGLRRHLSTVIRYQGVPPWRSTESSSAQSVNGIDRPSG